MKIQHLTTIGALAALLTASGNQLGAATVYVSQTSANPSPPYSTWDTAAHTIQEAVDAANDSDTVSVAAGEYALTNQVTIAKAIVVESAGGPSQTIVNGQGRTRCLWISNSLAVIHGFTIWRGYEGGPAILAGNVVVIGGVLSNCVVQYSYPQGRLVYCSSGGLITHCQITDGNFGSADGAGVYLLNSQLRDSLISRIQGNVFGRPMKGAGVYAISSTISGCTITDNWAAQAGGGAYLQECEVDRCVIVGNAAGKGNPSRGGGIFAINSIVRNSVIARNRVVETAAGGDVPVPGFGGGVYLQGGRLISCTVAQNSASGAGSGLYVETGAVRNSIVYFNSGSSSADWYNAGGGLFDHTCTTPNPGGSGNIVADPKFIDHTDGNYRLAAASPCIDEGINESWMSSAQDLDGNPRIYNNDIVDIGAYESTHTSSQPVISLFDVDPEAFETLSESGVIRFNRTGDPAQEIEVHWTFSGSAGNGSDFQQLPTSSPFPNGNEAYLTITPIDDTEVENTETITVTLLDGPGYRVGSPSTATVTIIDNESDEPVISLSDLDPEAFEEGSDTGVIRFSRTGNPLQEIEVYWTFSGTAANGSDFEQLPTNSPFPAGSQAYLTITPIDDAEAESSETITVTLLDGPGYRVGAHTSATVTLRDNDP